MCLQEDKLILEAPSKQPGSRSRSKRQRRDTTNEMLELVVKKKKHAVLASRATVSFRALTPSLSSFEGSFLT